MPRGNKDKSTYRSLDARIAEALNGEAVTPALLSDLIIEVEDALPISSKALEAERVRLVDPSNRDFEKTQKIIDTIKLEKARLEAALPILQRCYRDLTNHEHSTEWSSDYAVVEKERDKLAEELSALYPDMVEKFVSLFERIEHCDKNVDIINRTAPRGETRRLKHTELTARSLDHFTAIQPSLAKTVKLPHPGETCQLAWPPVDVSFAIGAADQVYNLMAARSAAYGPDWAEAKKADDAKKLAEWERRNALLKEQQEAAKREYQEAQHRAARGE